MGPAKLSFTWGYKHREQTAIGGYWVKAVVILGGFTPEFRGVMGAPTTHCAEKNVRYGGATLQCFFPVKFNIDTFCAFFSAKISFHNHNFALF